VTDRGSRGGGRPPDDQLLALLWELQDGPNVPVIIDRLRPRLPEYGKAELDRLLLEMADRGLVSLTPQRLVRPDDRAVLIEDEYGRFYSTVLPLGKPQVAAPTAGPAAAPAPQRLPDFDLSVIKSAARTIRRQIEREIFPALLRSIYPQLSEDQIRARIAQEKAQFDAIEEAAVASLLDIICELNHDLLGEPEGGSTPPDENDP